MLPTKNLPFSLPVLSGLFLVLCQPPVSLFPLAFVALTPLLVDIYGRNLRQSFLRGFVTGLVAFTGLVYWVVVSMNTYGGLSPTLSLLVLALLVSYLALYVGFFAWSVTYFQSKGLESYLTAPLIWVALEYGRGFLLSGFPWSFLAHSQQQFLPLIQIASVTGTYFVSYLLVAVSAIASFVIRRRTVPWPFFAATTLLVVISIAFGINRLQVSEKGDLRTAIIQGNMPQDVKWDADFKA
ncbi:MAG TPA: apolipoprotein N-acyltransferase, partial [Deltaproteobacteria bacterium]|nr:apolipoprotein N-acyltransferase [Deltaproteobacteria bacterium]